MKQLLIILFLLTAPIVFAQQAIAPKSPAPIPVTPKERADKIREAYNEAFNADAVANYVSGMLVDKSDCNKQVLMTLRLNAQAKMGTYGEILSVARDDFSVPKGWLFKTDDGTFVPPVEKAKP